MILTAIAGLAAQDPAGVIEGSVRDASSRAPLPDVEVLLTASRVRSKVMTDAAGGFRFEHLPAGDYRVGYSKPGYTGSNITGVGKVVHLKDGAATERLSIDLPSVAEVEGLVLGEEGLPIHGALVHSPNGNGPSTTDEAGRYHLEILIPRPNRLEVRVPYELRLKTVKLDPESGETFGYANTQYYPGTVDFAPGVHLRGFDIRLRRTRLVTLSGHAIDTAKSRDLEIELSPEGAPLPDETYQRRPLGADGAFRFNLIEPGRYALLVYHGSEHSALPYVTAVEVPTAGLEDLKVAVPAFVQIRGVITTAKPEQRWTGRAAITLRDPTAPGRTKEFVIDGASEFLLDAVPPGRWRVEVKADAKPLIVTGVRFGNQAAPEPFLVAESGNPPLEITLSDQTGTVAGTVVDGRQQPVNGALIVVRQPGGSLVISNVYRTGPDGSFRSGDLPPGQYEVSAWEDGRPGIDPPPKGNGLAAKVDVKAGETAVVRLVVDLM